ncbi:hypothetical protein [Marinicellulosiphila megalodicopiae]|uniref:hypothetical protein n=1 Tax=Marinicellulosiphila megalodicopiae TaxID=2724896 RepID=UPI003BB106DF
MDPILFTLLFICFFVVIYAVAIYFYVRLLINSLDLCGEGNRKIEPSFVWIEFFPFVGQGWNILISYQICISLRDKIEMLSNWRSTTLLFAFGLSHSFVLAANMVALFFIPQTTAILFPLAMGLMACWVWQLISVNKFIAAQGEQY